MLCDRRNRDSEFEWSTINIGCSLGEAYRVFEVDLNYMATDDAENTDESLCPPACIRGPGLHLIRNLSFDEFRQQR
jgi:hypothetical protein